MARRGSGEIYQVDLIAALFGGFMISWLVSAQETDFQVYSKPLKFATLEMRVAGDHSASGSVIWINALPVSTVAETGCIGSELAEDLIGGIRRYVSCSSESAESLNTSVTTPARALLYWNNVVDTCRASTAGSPFPRTRSFYANWTLDAVVPSYLSPIGTVHRRFDATETNTSSVKPVFLWTRSSGNCRVRRDDRLANQLFLVSDFDQQSVDSVPFPISSGSGALLLTGTLSGSSSGAALARKFLFSNTIQLVDANDEIIVGRNSTSLSNLRVEAVLCVFSEGTETCYGGEQVLTNAGAPALTLTKGFEPW